MPHAGFGRTGGGQEVGTGPCKAKIQQQGNLIRGERNEMLLVLMDDIHGTSPDSRDQPNDSNGYLRQICSWQNQLSPACETPKAKTFKGCAETLEPAGKNHSKRP